MSKDLARLDADRALILAGVSHDLRTPLSRLRLGLEMSGADPHLREGMTSDIEEMDRTINQFLDFARSDGGETQQSADLAAIAAEVAEHYRRRGKSVATELSVVPRLPLQALSMRRVVQNLLDNALRYGERDVSVAVRAEDGAVVLEVADRGPGIPAAEVERLKQPFTRLEVARSDKGGAGLGLAIVERVARARRRRPSRTHPASGLEGIEAPGGRGFSGTLRATIQKDRHEETARHPRPGRRSRGLRADLPREKPALLAGFPGRGRIRHIGAASAVRAEEEMPLDRNHHPVQAGRGRRRHVEPDELAAGRRAQRGRNQPAAHRARAVRRPGAVQDRGHRADVLVSLHQIGR